MARKRIFITFHHVFKLNEIGAARRFREQQATTRRKAKIMGLFSGNPLKRAEKAVKKAGKQVTGAVSDAWHKSGLDKQWNQWGRDVFQVGGAMMINPVLGAGVALAKGAEMLAEEMTPEIPEPKTESPGSGVMVDQTSVASDALLAARKRASARISLSSTNHTGQSLMRTGSLKSTLG